MIDATKLHTKRLEDLTLEEMAYIHLTTFDTTTGLDDGHIYSSLGRMVGEMTQVRSLDVSRIYVPLFSAFAIFDQLGSCYSDRSMAVQPNVDASGVKKALHYFAGLSYKSAETKALWELRNSLLHDGSLMSRGRFESGRWKGPFHRFILGSKDPAPITLPAVPWDGDLDSSMDHITYVNQRAVTDLAIAAVRKANNLLQEGALSIDVDEGAKELYYRYLFHQPYPSTTARQ